MNTPGNPTGLNDPPHSESTVHSADSAELSGTPSNSIILAGPHQTKSFGVNVDLPIIGDVTGGITIEFGKEYDFGLFLEHGTIVPPYAIEKYPGISVAPDSSAGINFFVNDGYVPFETGIVDTKEVMGQYGLGGGFNFDSEGRITSRNGYIGVGAGVSATYDRTYNFSYRDLNRWYLDQITQLNDYILSID